MNVKKNKKDFGRAHDAWWVSTSTRCLTKLWIGHKTALQCLNMTINNRQDVSKTESRSAEDTTCIKLRITCIPQWQAQGKGSKLALLEILQISRLTSFCKSHASQVPANLSRCAQKLLSEMPDLDLPHACGLCLDIFGLSKQIAYKVEFSCLRDGCLRQIGWIFGKVPKGGSFSIETFMLQILGTLNWYKKNNSRVQGMFFFKLKKSKQRRRLQ